MKNNINILMVIGLMVSCWVLLNCLNLVDKIANEMKSTDSFRYSSTILLQSDVTSNDIAHLMEYLAKIDTANISVLDMNVRLNSTLNQYNFDIILNSNEPLNIVLNDNSVVEELNTISPNGCVLVGETVAKSLNIDAGDTVYFYDIPFQVSGIMENNMSGNIDNRIYLLWENLTDDEKGQLLSNDAMQSNFEYFCIQLNSNSELNSTYSKILNEVSDKFQYSLTPIDSTYRNGYQNYWYKFYNSMFLIVSLVFSIATCLIVGDLWIDRNKYDLTIRKVFGYTNLKLFMLIARYVFKLSTVSIFLTVVIQVVYLLLSGSAVKIYSFVGQVVIVYIVMLLIIMLIAQHCLYTLNKTSIIDVLKRKDI
jgi:hypothetical protein